MTQFRRVVAEQAESDFAHSSMDETWLEFDASVPGLRVYRRLQNDRLVFRSMEHLRLFMKRVEERIRHESQLSTSLALLFVSRERNHQKTKELVFKLDWYVLLRVCLMLMLAVTLLAAPFVSRGQPKWRSHGHCFLV